MSSVIERTPALTAAVAALLVVVLVAVLPAWGGSAKTKRMSLRSDGSEVNDVFMVDRGISTTARYVVFDSTGQFTSAPDLGDDIDVFIRDRRTGKTKRVSLRSDESEVNGIFNTDSSGVSRDGRFVVFKSNGVFTEGDTNGDEDIFVRDRKRGRTQRVSVRSNGGEVDAISQGDRISDDGRFVIFESNGAFTGGDADNDFDVFRHDRRTGKTRLVSVRSNGSRVNDADTGSIDVSGDGRFVLFQSDGAFTANDAGDDDDAFVRDRRTGRTKRVSLRSNEQELNVDSDAAAISAGGRYVVFDSTGDFAPGPDGGLDDDVFVRDRKTGKTRRVSVRSDGTEVNAASDAEDISPNGRFVVFESDGALVGADSNGASDIYVHDRRTGKTKRASVTSTGVQVDADSFGATISGRGPFVTFRSQGQFTGGDAGLDSDVFLRGPLF